MGLETNAEKKKKKRKKRSGDAVHPDSVDRGGVADPKKRSVKAKEQNEISKKRKSEEKSAETKPVSNWDRLKGTLKTGRKRRPPQDGLFINITADEIDAKDVRGHLTKVLALDCEMVGGGVGGQLSLLARVSIVNASGDVVYDTFVSPTERITDYRTQWSGIRPKDLVGAPNKQIVVEKVRSILAGRILVGHALQNDLEALNISHPESHVRDSSRYPQFMRKLICGKLKPKALRHIVAEELNMTIQTGEHDSVQDARAVLGLYQKHKSSWETWHSKEMKRLKRRRMNST